MMKLNRLLAALLCLALLLANAALAEGAPEAKLQHDLLVLFTSDVHCGVDQNFGYAGLQAVLDAARATGDHVMLVDNGDSIQGEAIGMLSRGEASIQLMNEMGYDVAIPGNHEFDYGMDRFMELAGMAKFPYISCNFRKNGELVFEPYIIKEFDGVKIGFVGVATPLSLSTATPRYFQDEQGNFIYDFMQSDDGKTLYAGIQKAVDDARAEGAQYVILISHLGNKAHTEPYTYADVIQNTRGIDAVLDGHSHDTDKVVMKNLDGKDVVRQACGTKMQGIGWMRLSAADGTVDTGLYTWTNDKSATELMGLYNRMSQSVAQMGAVYESMLNVPLGTAPVTLTIADPVAKTDSGMPVRIVRNSETNLGDFVTDAIRAGTGADVSIAGGGSIRVNIEKGPITLGDVIRVFPFNNQIVKIEVTGQQLLDALEYGASLVPLENGGFLQVSGLTYEIHTYIESGCQKDQEGMLTGIEGERRVKNVMVGDQPLDPEKTYTLAGAEYVLMDHGDGYTCFDGAKLLAIHDESDYQVLAAYITQTLNGDFDDRYADPYGEGRIVAVEQAPAK